MKKTVRQDDNGKLFEVTKAQAKGEARLIPLTPASKTRWQKFVRAAVG